MKTFLDSGVLLTAWRGADAAIAISIIEDPAREFYTSDLVKLELLPKPACFKNHLEVGFYEMFFKAAKASEPLSPALGRHADRLARRYGLAALDALHIAAAIRQGAKEFITTESETKPLHRVTEIRVRALA